MVARGARSLFDGARECHHLRSTAVESVGVSEVQTATERANRCPGHRRKLQRDRTMRLWSERRVRATIGHRNERAVDSDGAKNRTGRLAQIHNRHGLGLPDHPRRYRREIH